MKTLSLVMLVLTACGDGNSATPDAEVDAPTMCPPKTAPLMPGVNKIYLNFDGQSLSKGNDNAPLNISSVLINDPTVVPVWGSALSASTRQGRIDLIVQTVQTQLAPYSVDVVTTRPVSGPYMMSVLGGKSQDFGFAANIASLTGQQCHLNAIGVSLVFDVDGFTATDTANSVLSDIGVLAGLGLSTRHNDCANRTEAYDPGIVCSFDAMATTANTANNCGYTPTQNEPMLLMTAFGCRD